MVLGFAKTEANKYHQTRLSTFNDKSTIRRSKINVNWTKASPSPPPPFGGLTAGLSGLSGLGSVAAKNMNLWHADICSVSPFFSCKCKDFIDLHMLSVCLHVDDTKWPIRRRDPLNGAIFCVKYLHMYGFRNSWDRKKHYIFYLFIYFPFLGLWLLKTARIYQLNREKSAAQKNWQQCHA